MAAITTGAVLGGAALLESRGQRRSAESAARQQAAGVESAQQQTQQATDRALPLIQQGFGAAQETLSPLSQLAQPALQEQQDLLGLGGQSAFQSALTRVSDPLVQEQERAFRRNSAAFGGVGGNVLSALAEQTRARTEANLGNRLQQLGAFSAPGLNALQQIAQLQAGEGTNLGNVLIGQGSEQAQLAQNLGTAQAGGAAFRAQQTPITGALQAGLGGFGAAGGFAPPPQQPQLQGGSIVNPNRFGGFA